MSASDLAAKTCVPCDGGTPTLPGDRARALLADLDGWTISADGTAISRRLTFRNFARAMQAANLAGWLGEREGHHPDISFGWGYCKVSFTTHAAAGLTDNDFICAAKLDRLLA